MRAGPVPLAVALLTAGLPAACAARAESPGPTPAQVRAAVGRSLPLLQKSAAQYTEHRDCFAYHHQALPVLALSTARARGFAVSDDDLQEQLEFTAASLERNRANYLKGRG